MKLQGRHLTLRMKGPDVAELHSELRALQYPIPAEEGHFSEITRKAVLDLQKREGLQPTGVVNPVTAAAINRLIDRLQANTKIIGAVKTDTGEAVVWARVEIVGTDVIVETN